MVRVDHERRGLFPAALEARLLAFVEDCLPRVEACVLSDHAKEVVSATLARYLIRHEAGLFLGRELFSPEDVPACAWTTYDPAWRIG
jgi:hypothetical protein